MPNPLQVESAFHELTVRLETTVSIRHRYRLIKDFLRLLNGEFKKYETYIIQLTDEIPSYTSPLSWSGLDPKDIESDIDLFENVSAELSLSKKENPFADIINRLREVCLLLYCCLNERQNADNYLNRLFGIRLPSDSIEPEKESFISVFQNLIREAIQSSQNVSAKKRNDLQDLLTQINFIQDKEYGKALIPVIESYEENESTEISYGRLRQLSVEIYGDASEQDFLIQNFRIYGAEKPIQYQKKEALVAARKLLLSQASNIKEIFFKGGISFELSGAMHDGGSANAAISALWYTRLQKATGQRERFEVDPHTVITGDIDRNCNILPVDEHTIGLKTKAAFFSWAALFVVPASQRHLFEEELKQLQKKYPHRNLVLIAVNTLDEMFFDRRLASHDVQSRLKYYYNRLKDQQYRVFGIPVIFILLLTIGRMWYGPIDQNPVAGEFEGEVLILKNRYDQEITSVAVGEKIVESVKNGNTAKVAFYDMDYDGVNEVFFARQVSEKNERRGDELIAFSAKGDSVIWSNPLDYTLDFPNKPGIADQGYRIFDINFIEDSASREAALVANVAHKKFFPGLLVKINIYSGMEISRYVHTGQIRYTLTEDFDDDGADEIAGLGQNNAFGEHTVMFVLEPDRISGHSPLTDEYEINGFEPANETHYILFPQTLVGKAFRRRVMSNNPADFFINPEEKLIEARVHDFRLDNPSPFETDRADLFFYFTYDFKIRSIDTSSYYDLWVKNLYEDGRIPFEPDYEYFEAFKDSILYWNGEGFVLKDQIFSN